ncbi:MAG: hypothetical protein IT212_07755 [Bacteroidia bacterium]|nr:hypothetical protein [Bacteroidia bacterium]
MNNPYNPDKMPTLTEMLIEQHGQSYVDLLSKDKEIHENHIRQSKSEIIGRIMYIRHQLHKSNTASDFDELYDLSLHDIMCEETKYIDMLHKFNSDCD